MKHRNITPFLFGILFLSLSFSSCNKLPTEEIKEIERYKNSPRDPQIIGKWIFKNEREVTIEHFTENGMWESGNPVYNERGEIIHYKKIRSEVYFYTENNLLHYLTIVREKRVLGVPPPLYTNYKIIKDTLYMSTELKGIKDNNAILRD